ncbi:hypothetical protein AB0M29_34570 [Streptomyces sp. NPDC051976]|uniref:hypothetical protein n=1 Tax=Streptomyces sp. NPDC051976 TaxID=3154947 RepID=UPI003441E434
MYYQELIDSPRTPEFRTTPAAVHGVHANRSLANSDLDLDLNLEDDAEAAVADPEGVLRPM